MNTINAIITSIVFSGMGAAVVTAQDFERWNYQEGTLDNGLRVLTVEDHTVPLVSVQVWYHVGSKDEDPQRQGFAHMFEHMMFRGTDRIGPQDHFKYLSRYGARVNGYTSFDRTVYLQTLPASQLDLALWLEAERMANLKINEDYFAAEREVVKEERRKRYLNQPYGRLFEQLYAAAYQQHPYRWTPIGNLRHLNAATVDELREFFNTYYVPNNTTLIIVGAVKHEQVMARVREHFGDIPRRPEPPRVTITEEPMTEPRLVEMTDQAPSPLVLLAYHSPPDPDPDAIAMDVLARVLSAGQSSWLYRHLVQGKEIAVQASGYNAAQEQGGLFVVSAVLKPDVPVEVGQEALLDEVATLLEQGVSEKELEKAKNQALAEQVQAGETVQGRARQIGYAAVILGDPKRAVTDLQRIQELTVDQIMSVARRVLRPDNRITLIIRPDDQPPEVEEVDEVTAAKEEELVELPPPPEMPLGETPKPVTIPSPTLRELPNGMKVAVFEDHALPAVTVSLNLLTGAKHDPADQAGLAYVTFNTLRRGTTRHSGDELSERIDFHGMSLLQRVGHEDSSVKIWALRDHLDLATETLSEIVREPAFHENEVMNFVSRSAAAQAISEQEGSTIATRLFSNTIYGDYYLSRPQSGTSGTLNNITPEAVIRFHRSYVQPDISTLVFAGDVTPEQAYELTEKWFGDWEGKAETRKAVPPPPRRPMHILAVDRPQATQSEIRIGQLADVTRHDDDYAQVRLLSHLFGESFSSRLNQTLRIQMGLTYGSRGTFDVDAEVAAFRIATYTRTDRTSDAIAAAVKEVRELDSDPVTPDELAATRDTLVGQFQMGMETASSIADIWWKRVVWQLPENWHHDYQQSILQVKDPEALRETARREIDPSRLSIVVVGNIAEIREQLEQIAPVEVVSQDEESKPDR